MRARAILISRFPATAVAISACNVVSANSSHQVRLAIDSVVTVESRNCSNSATGGGV